MVFPQKEISDALMSIQDILISISISNSIKRTCNLLKFLIIDIETVSRLFVEAEKLNRMSKLREEKKKFQSFVGTIEFWSKSKDWDSLCSSIIDIEEELLIKVFEINNMLNKKVVQKKTKKNESLVSDDDFKNFKNKIQDKVNKAVEEKQNKVNRLKKSIIQNKEELKNINDNVEIGEDKLKRIFKLTPIVEKKKNLRDLIPFL